VITIGRIPDWTASTAVARTQPLVVQPAISSRVPRPGPPEEVR
jgi:hypothetical protein